LESAIPVLIISKAFTFGSGTVSNFLLRKQVASDERTALPDGRTVLSREIEKD